MRNSVEHRYDGELGQIVVGGDQYRDVFILRRPNIRVRRPEENYTVRSGGGREMRNSGIVTDKSGLLEKRSELRQRKIVGKTNARFIVK